MLVNHTIAEEQLVPNRFNLFFNEMANLFDVFRGGEIWRVLCAGVNQGHSDRSFYQLLSPGTVRGVTLLSALDGLSSSAQSLLSVHINTQASTEPREHSYTDKDSLLSLSILNDSHYLTTCCQMVWQHSRKPDFHFCWFLTCWKCEILASKILK